MATNAGLIEQYLKARPGQTITVSDMFDELRDAWAAK